MRISPSSLSRIKALSTINFVVSNSYTNSFPPKIANAHIWCFRRASSLAEYPDFSRSAGFRSILSSSCWNSTNTNWRSWGSKELPLWCWIRRWSTRAMKTASVETVPGPKAIPNKAFTRNEILFSSPSNLTWHSLWIWYSNLAGVLERKSLLMKLVVWVSMVSTVLTGGSAASGSLRFFASVGDGAGAVVCFCIAASGGLHSTVTSVIDLRIELRQF